MVAGALLMAALCMYAWFLRGGPIGSLGWPVRRLPRLAVRTVLTFGLVPIIALLALGRWGALIDMPVEFEPLAAIARQWLPGLAETVSLIELGAGVIAGGALGAFVAWWRGRPGPTLGRVDAVLPRGRGELGWAALLAVVAGIGEELFFRSVLPLLIALVSGSAWTGFATATALFAWAHRYQGWIGVAATAATGVLLALLYLASGKLWVAVALHGAIDLNVLVVRPMLAGFKPSAASRF